MKKMENPYLATEDWIDAVELMIKNVPPLQSVDLIIEGCINNNSWCAYWLSRMLPSSTYVGIDLATTTRALTRHRVDQGIDAELYDKILDGQDQLRTDRGESSKVTLRANCLAPALIQSLKDFVGAKNTLFVTFNGLVALLGRDYNPGEHKQTDDLTPADSVITTDLFRHQLHIAEYENGQSLWEMPLNILSRGYHQAEQIAGKNNLHSTRIEDGIFISDYEVN